MARIISKPSCQKFPGKPRDVTNGET